MRHRIGAIARMAGGVVAVSCTAVFSLAGTAGVAHAEEARVPVVHGLHDVERCAHVLQLPPPGDEGALSRWREVLPQCQRDPYYLTRLGQMYLARKQYSEAADHLERALLFAPDLRDAQIGYVIALAGVGDFAASSALVDELLTKDDLPDRLRAELRPYSGSWSLASSGWVTTISAGLRAGRDSNLSGTPRLTSLTLTLPGGTLTLPLADGGFAPRPGNYLRSDARVDLRRLDTGGTQWDVSLGARAQRNSAARDMESRGADLAVERTQWLGAGTAGGARNGFYVGLSALALRPSENTDYASLGAGAGGLRGWSLGASSCIARLGAEVERRRHPSNELLSGRYAGLASSVTCQAPSQLQWFASLRRGRDSAGDAGRPGGDQAQTALRMAVFIPVPELLQGTGSGVVLADAEWSRLQDDRGYNPWYEYDRTREVRRAVARVEYQARLGGGLRAILGAEWLQQQSSIALFRVRSSGPYAALRMTW